LKEKEEELKKLQEMVAKIQAGVKIIEEDYLQNNE
jgi:hypothetical protein